MCSDVVGEDAAGGGGGGAGLVVAAKVGEGYARGPGRADGTRETAGSRRACCWEDRKCVSLMFVEECREAIGLIEAFVIYQGIPCGPVAPVAPTAPESPLMPWIP